MAFKWVKGKSKIEWMPKKASTAITKGALMMIETGATGYMTKASTTAATIKGILLKTIASTDSDYASNTLVPIEIPRSNVDAVLEADVTNGTLVAASVGSTFDLKDEQGVDQATDTIHQVECVGFISASKGLFRLADAGTSV